ncbi:MAG: DNA methyltransferase [bacterium]
MQIPEHKGPPTVKTGRFERAFFFAASIEEAIVANEGVTTTELIWPGKKTEVDRVSLPFQTVETVNKPRVDQPRFDFGEWPENYPRDWKNKLIWGDNKYVMASLLKEFAGKIDLIYIDPPFATGADFTFEVEIGDAEVTKQASVIEELAYRDTWGKGMGSYLQMIYERLALMKELLEEEGSLFVHVDYRVNSHIRLVLDEIFGRDSLINEISWCYGGGGAPKTFYPRKHDTIFWYTKSDEWTFHKQYRPYSEGTERTGFRSKGMADYELDPRGAGLNDWWPDCPKILSYNAAENWGYPTQKPESLIKRIIVGHSDEGDLVADFFCGSGTVGAVAEKLGRRWIMSDLSRFAIQTTRKRLLNLHAYSTASSTLEDYHRPTRPLEILNMGSYQKHKFTENGYPPVEQYIEFILKLYRAQRLEGYAFLHGRRGRRLVHVSGVDSIVTEGEVRDTAEECGDALGGRAVDILGWDFEMGLDELVGRIGDEYGIDIELVQIPREAMELTSPDAEIRFFDMNYLEVTHSVDKRKLVIQLEDFIIANMEYVPEELQESVDKFTDYIDYWAVDFDYQEDTFHNMWQSFRTRQRQRLDTGCVHVYDQPGDHQVLVKVIDVFGNDTNKLLEVSVR